MKVNKKKISMFIISASIIGGINFADKPVYAVENNANKAKVESSTEIKSLKGQVVNVNTNLNIRESAGTNSSIVGCLVNGERVTIKGKTGDWYNIDYNGKPGYIYKDFVREFNGDSPTKPVEKPSATSSSKGEVVNVSTNLRMRSSASTSASIVGYLNSGDKFNIKEKSGEWYLIELNGKTGYIHKDYVKEINNDTPSKPTEPKPTSSQKPGDNATSPVYSKGEVINVSTNLNIRESARTNSSIVGYLVNGQQFNIKGITGDWYNIDFNGKPGYIYKDFVREFNSDAPTKPVEKPNVASSSKGEVVNVSTNLRMRSSNSASASIVAYLNSGDKFNIKEKSGEWYLIELNGKTGYVHKDYVKEINNDTPSKPVEPKPTPSEKPGDNATSPVYSKGEVTDVSTNLRMRADASINSNIVGYLKNGDKLSIKGMSGDWYSIEFNGKSGYVHKDYVKESNNDTPSKPPIDVPDQTKLSKGEVINVNTNLRMRKEPNTNSSVVSYLIGGQKFNINSKSGDWYFIEYDNKVGYIHKDYANVLGSEVPDTKPPTSPIPSVPDEVLSDLGIGMIYNVSTNLRLRNKASSSDDSKVLAYILPGKTCNIIGTAGQWYKVTYDGKTGYVSKDYVKRIYSSELRDPADYENVYNIALSAMKSHIGSPYVWGGSGEFLTTAALNSLILRFPNEARRGMYDISSAYTNSGYRAFDCASLMQWGFRQAGISISRTACDQVNNGVEVSKANVKPGDLLFFSDLNHVGMYIGNGQWIALPDSRSFVMIMDVPWYKISRIRRVI